MGDDHSSSWNSSDNRKIKPNKNNNNDSISYINDSNSNSNSDTLSDHTNCNNDNNNNSNSHVHGDDNSNGNSSSSSNNGGSNGGSGFAKEKNSFSGKESKGERGGNNRNRYMIGGGGGNSNRSVGDDYMTVVSDMIYPKVSFGNYASTGNIDEGEYPLERINTLGILLCGARRRTAFEKWNPYEIALFEGAISLFGKEFHVISKIVGTKTCKECIEFYYLWKKTHHYHAWKKSYERTNKMEEEDDGSGDGEKEREHLSPTR